MTTKIYQGNYTLQAGLPYVFITVWRDERNYKIEVIVLFHGFDNNVRVKGQNFSFPVEAGFTEDNVFAHAEELAKEFILYNIILRHYEHTVAGGTVPPVQLRETNDTLLMFLRKRLPDNLRHVRVLTSSNWLQGRIDFYSGIQFHEDETYGDDE